LVIYRVNRSLTKLVLLHYATRMASYYVRDRSPYYWLRFQRPDGTWGCKSSGIRIDSPGSVRKAKQAVAQETMHETQFDGNGGSHRFDSWVPQFLEGHYKNPKTTVRYLNAWSALSTYLSARQIISPSQITYQLCMDYPAFRTNPPKELMRARSYNTALTELKVFSSIMQEAVRRDYIQANPCTRLGLKRRNVKVKPALLRAQRFRLATGLISKRGWATEEPLSRLCAKRLKSTRRMTSPDTPFLTLKFNRAILPKPRRRWRGSRCTFPAPEHAPRGCACSVIRRNNRTPLRNSGRSASCPPGRAQLSAWQHQHLQKFNGADQRSIS